MAEGLLYVVRNALAEAWAVTATATVDALFPLTNLYDGLPETWASWTTSTQKRVTGDLSRVRNPGFETASPALEHWTSVDGGTGVSTRDTAVKQFGTASLKCVLGGSGAAGRRQNVVVRSGELLELRLWMRQDGSGSGVVRITNLDTDRRLSSGGQWLTVAGTFAASTVADTAAAFVEKVVQFQVEPAAGGGVRDMTLEVQLFTGLNSTVYYDDVTLDPAINFGSMHGHNLPAGWTLRLASSPTGAFAGEQTNHTDLVPRQPSFYAHLQSPVYDRHWGMVTIGTGIGAGGAAPPQIPRYGQMIFGHARELAARPDWGFQTVYHKDQSRQRSPTGAQSVTGVGGARRRLARWSFHPDAEDDVMEIREEVLERCGYGERPIVIVPPLESSEVIMGILTEDHAVRRQFQESWETDLFVEELPFGRWIG